MLIGYVNNTKQSTALSGGTYASSVANFSINQGRRSDTTDWDNTRTIDMVNDSAFFMNRLITDDEATYLYNSAAGKDYATLLSDAGM